MDYNSMCQDVFVWFPVSVATCCCICAATWHRGIHEVTRAPGDAHADMCRLGRSNTYNGDHINGLS